MTLVIRTNKHSLFRMYVVLSLRWAALILTLTFFCRIKIDFKDQPWASCQSVLRSNRERKWHQKWIQAASLVILKFEFRIDLIFLCMQISSYAHNVIKYSHLWLLAAGLIFQITWHHTDTYMTKRGYDQHICCLFPSLTSNKNPLQWVSITYMIQHNNMMYITLKARKKF